MTLSLTEIRHFFGQSLSLELTFSFLVISIVECEICQIIHINRLITSEDKKTLNIHFPHWDVVGCGRH